MKTFSLNILMIALPLCAVASINNQPEIKLSQAKDRVVPASLRTSILEVAEQSLNRSDEAFIAVMEKVKNPYPVKKAEKKEPLSDGAPPKPPIGDESILKLIQANFAPQVRGTLAKGTTNYLQLNGGGLLKEGDSFPVQIPQIENRSFTVKVMGITTRGYTLKMNDVVQEITFKKSSGIIKDSAK